MARYWVGGTGNWNDTAHWSTSSGGASGAAVPTAADDTVFDASSGAGTATITANAACRSLASAGSSVATLVHNAAVTLSIGDGTAGAGNVAIDLSGFTTYTRGSTSTTIIAFVSTSATVQTINWAGKTAPASTFNGAGGSWRLSAAMTTSGGSTITLTAGTFATNGQTCIWGKFATAGTVARTLTLGASTVTVLTTGVIWSVSGSNYVFNAGTSTIAITDATASGKTFAGGNGAFHNLTITAGGAGGITVQNSNSFSTFTINAPKTVIFTAGTTQTITTAFVAIGSAGNVITLQSSSAGSAATLSKSGPLVACDWLSVKDSYATGGASWFAGANSTNVSGNTGWVFSAPVETPTSGGAVASGNSPTIPVAGAVFRGTVREKPPLRLHRELITPSGKRYRWSDDEPDPANVPSGGTHSSEMPGGFAASGCVLPRKSSVDYADLERLSTLIVRGAGGEVVSECRLERTPRTSGNEMSVSPDAVGWQANLEDDKSARIIYVDRDLARFIGMSSARRVALLGASPAWSLHDQEVRPDGTNGLPALHTSIKGAWATRAVAEALYDAGSGLKIAKVYYDFLAQAAVNPADAAWMWGLDVSATDDFASVSTTGDLSSGASGSGYFDPATPARYLKAALAYTAAAGVEGTDYDLGWRNMASYGDHGLDLHGDDPGGLLASDIVAHAVARWAPLLNIGAESIQQSSFIVPHSAFLEPTTAAEIVKQVSRFNLPDWAVWEDKEFVWHERGSRGRSWRARVAPAELTETGPQVDRLWNAVFLPFQDVDGSTKTVGPPGSGANTEDARLKDSDPDHPANKLGLTLMPPNPPSLGTMTTAGAVEIGARVIEEAKLADTSGQAKFVGHVEDDRGVTHPYWRVRAGDTVTFVDASNPTPRRIVKASHDDASRTCTVDLDSPPEGLAATLERMGVVGVPLGVGN